MSTRTTRKIGRSGDRFMRLRGSRKPVKTEIPSTRFPRKHVRSLRMGVSRRAATAVASITLIAFLGGCFGYNKSAKRWAYVGDSILLVGGGTAIAIDVTQKESRCMPDAMGNGCTFQPS